MDKLSVKFVFIKAEELWVAKHNDEATRCSWGAAQGHSLGHMPFPGCSGCAGGRRHDNDKILLCAVHSQEPDENCFFFVKRQAKP